MLIIGRQTQDPFEVLMCKTCTLCALVQYRTRGEITGVRVTSKVAQLGTQWPPKSQRYCLPKTPIPATANTYMYCYNRLKAET